MNDDLEPILDDGSDEGHGWQRFTSGQGMATLRSYSHLEVWPVVALVLAASAALLFVSAILRTFDFAGMSVGERVFFVAVEGGAWQSGVLVLAAACVEFARRELQQSQLTRWTLIGSTAVSAVILVSAVYAVGYLLLAHPNGSSIGDAITRSAVADWSVRLSGILTVLAAALLAGLALFVVRRHREESTRPSVPHEAPTPYLPLGAHPGARDRAIGARYDGNTFLRQNGSA